MNLRLMFSVYKSLMLRWHLLLTLIVLCSCCCLIKFGAFQWNVAHYTELDQRLQQSLQQLKQSKQRLQQLQRKLRVQDTQTLDRNTCEEPCLQYEETRRRLRKNNIELWYFLRAALLKLRSKFNVTIDSNWQSVVDCRIASITERKRSLHIALQRLQQIDGFTNWRSLEANQLTNLLLQRIHHQQNPANCHLARKMILEFEWIHGYGGHLRNLVQFLIAAHAHNRTLILHIRQNAYNDLANDWQQLYQPISSSCQHLTDLFQNETRTSGYFYAHTQVVYVDLYDVPWIYPAQKTDPVHLDLRKRLQRNHGDPIAWWVAQHAKYLTRPLPPTQMFLEKAALQLESHRPIVGVHIRRGDKIIEADYHLLQEYMFYVDDYYETLEMEKAMNVSRRIFLASDEPQVIAEARREYTNYEVLANIKSAELAYHERNSNRKNFLALSAALQDLHLLSLCDYLVCTLSSGFCRAAYEIQQTQLVDVVQRYKSLDVDYQNFNLNRYYWLAIRNHKPRAANEIELRFGDKIYVRINFWNGSSSGQNLRTKNKGHFPTFKVDRLYDTKGLIQFLKLDHQNIE